MISIQIKMHRYKITWLISIYVDTKMEQHQPIVLVYELFEKKKVKMMRNKKREGSHEYRRNIVSIWNRKILNLITPMSPSSFFFKLENYKC